MENEKALDDWCLEIEKAFEKSPNEKLAATRSVPPVDLAKVRERAMRSPRLPFLDPLPANIVIAVESHPGFSYDLSSWNLTIDQEGNLHQHILVDTRRGKLDFEHREEIANIGVAEVERLLKLSNEIGFPHFEDGGMCITDTGSRRISIRVNGQIETVVDNANPCFTDESQEKFYDLWQEIYRHAPFHST